MRLDFLHNFPLSQQANEILLQQPFPNPPIFVPKHAAKQQLCDFFDAKIAISMGFDAWSFLGFFKYFERFGKIAYSIGNHQQMHFGLRMLECSCLLLNKQKGILCFKSLCDAIDLGCKVFVIPAINQDIFTQQHLQEIFDFLAQRLEDFIFVVDISLALSLDMQPKIWDARVVFLVDGENLGLLRGNGLLLAQKDFNFPFVLEQNGIYEAFMHAIYSKEPLIGFSQQEFFDALKARLKDHIALFFDLHVSAPNTLALRFFGIKARMLLQDLFIKGIFGVNGQECLFGLSQPSFVLQQMGYLKEEARELLSLSIKTLQNQEELIDGICESYYQIRALGL